MNTRKQFIIALAGWGKKQAKLPSLNSEIKSRVLNTLPQQVQKTPYRFSWKLMLLPIGVLAILAVTRLNYFIQAQLQTATYSDGYSAASLSAPEAQTYGLNAKSLGANSVGGVVADYYDYKTSYPIYNNGGVPINDAREFLKTSFNANLKTRNVTETQFRLELLIENYGGRLDSSHGGKEYGNLTFVLPKKNFAAFRSEMRQLVGSRFYDESLDRENLLPQKVNLENQEDSYEERIQRLKELEEYLTKTYTVMQRSINNKIRALKTEIVNLNKLLTENQDESESVKQKIEKARQEQRILEMNLAGSAKEYNEQLQEQKDVISLLEKKLQGSKIESENLESNVETVNCAVYLDFVSIPKIIRMYLSDYWPLLLVLIPVIYILLPRGRTIRVP